MSGREVRPAREYLLPGYGMSLPSWFVDWLERNTDLGTRRAVVRGADRAVDEVLLAMRSVAVQHRAGSDAGTGVGTSLPVHPEPAPALDVLGVAAAGGLIGMSGRAVRKAIHEGRLPAKQVDGRWLITRQDAETYRRRRAA